MLLVSRRVIIIGIVILLGASTGVRAGYQVTNLASDIAGLAKITDPNLKNPWGVSSPPNGPIWVSDQANNTATLYGGSGSPLSLIVSIPTVNGAPNGPTGQVYNNNTSDFLLDGRGHRREIYNLDSLKSDMVVADIRGLLEAGVESR